ncbi:MAG: J domain-containing protein [Bdellovibrionaceae bacterium]|nr:J domain-containing protein [Pseudobdellovibrionaceae bacterium]
MFKSEFAKILEQKISKMESESQDFNNVEKNHFHTLAEDSGRTPHRISYLNELFIHSKINADLLNNLYKKTKSYSSVTLETDTICETNTEASADCGQKDTPPYRLHIKSVDGATYIAWVQLRKLGVSEFMMDSLSWSEAKKAFRSLARQLHPDTASVPSSPENFMCLKAAYDVIEDSFIEACGT